MLSNKEKVDYGLELIKNRRDTIRSWWVTVTSLFTAIIIGLTIAYFSNTFNQVDVDTIILLISTLSPVILVVISVIFFESIELNEMSQRLLRCLENESPNITINSIICLIKLRFEKRKGVNLRLKIMLVYATSFTFYPLFFSTLFSDPLQDITSLLLVFNVGITILLLFFVFKLHKKIIEIVNVWPSDFGDHIWSWNVTELKEETN